MTIKFQMLKNVNRSAVIISPKQAFFDMLGTLMSEEPQKAEEPFLEDASTIYLIDDADLEKATLKSKLAPYVKKIFYEEINSWFTDENRWPKSINWKEFENYFHISVQSMVFDTLDKKI